MVVVPSEDDDLASGKRSSKIFEERPRGGKCVTSRTMTQLEHVAEQDKPLNILKSVNQGRARGRAAQHVRA